MRFFHRKRSQTQDETVEHACINRTGWTIEPISVISKADCMIVRLSVKFPFVSQYLEQIDDFTITAKTGERERAIVSHKCVYIGEGECLEGFTGREKTKELFISVFVEYPEQDLIFSVVAKGSGKIIHEQFIKGSKLKDLRQQSDALFYRFCSVDPHYEEWFNNHKATKKELNIQRKCRLEFEPKFSIVVPLYKTPLNFFEDLMAAIAGQTYKNWELILVNASVEDENLTQSVNSVCENDPRINKIELEKNEGITLNTAKGIDVATGDFVCFIDHDDVIEPNCLFEYAKVANEDPETDLMYCDEDILFPDGHLGEVHFKPDFSLHLLRSNNYACHMLAIKRELLKELEYDNNKYDGAQDHHLTLQAVEKTEGIVHIPKVLYHWRANESSTAGGAGGKSYAAQAGIEAVSSHLKRIGVAAEVVSHPTLMFNTKVEYELPTILPKVSIVVLFKGSKILLERSIDFILEKKTYNNYEIIIVNRSKENVEISKYCKTSRSDERVKVIEFSESINLSKAIELGRRNASGEYVVLLDGGVKPLTSNWIENMLGVCMQKEVGIVGCKLLYPDDTIKHAGFYVGERPYNYFYNLPIGAINYGNYANIQREVSAVARDCMMFSTETYDAVGGFSEKVQSDLSDVDFCLRVRDSGELVVYNPYVRLYCYDSSLRLCDSDNDNQTQSNCEKKEIFKNLLDGSTIADPYHTPNVSNTLRGAYFNF